MTTNRARRTAPSRAGTIAIVGRPNVGKSTLMNALVGETLAITSPHPQTTRETVRGISTVEGSQFVWIDTPGLHAPRTELGKEMNRAARRALREADVALMVAAAPTDATKGEVDARDRKLAASLPAGPALLAINKIDRLKEKSALLHALQSFSVLHEFAAIVPVSAKTGDGVAALRDAVHALLPEQPPLFDPDTLSDQPMRFFAAEWVREQILRHTSQEVPHGVAVVVERFDESEEVVAIEVTVHAAREGHKKILIGADGNMIKRISTAAAARIEKMLARKVRLRIRVRVTRDWLDDASRLRAFGYAGREGDI
jgi:GTP-binding protein Era